ncbi:hypothetical protein EVAR_3402_1 [Eumeta japonica]|uniref:Uncharacterized protein n=1 Tax=Eumeta variegata TaxID=151549 RepID=A0A4C1SSG1_EUMVA|nr:hypothetical protein EVAR_3402_1 [Eumeta japonica]
MKQRYTGERLLSGGRPLIMELSLICPAIKTSIVAECAGAGRSGPACACDLSFLPVIRAVERHAASRGVTRPVRRAAVAVATRGLLFHSSMWFSLPLAAPPACTYNQFFHLVYRAITPLTMTLIAIAFSVVIPVRSRCVCLAFNSDRGNTLDCERHLESRK